MKAKFIIRRNGKILLQRDAKNKCWDLPTGNVKRKSDVPQQVREVTGYKTMCHDIVNMIDDALLFSVDITKESCKVNRSIANEVQYKNKNIIFKWFDGVGKAKDISVMLKKLRAFSRV